MVPPGDAGATFADGLQVTFRQVILAAGKVGLLAGLLLVGHHRTANAADDSGPSIGCPEEGQTGFSPAPTIIKNVPIVIRWAAEHLAYYKGTTLGVLAPRGWHCFGAWGSSGEVLIVTPGKLGAANFDAMEKEGIRGPAIEIQKSDGNTSGRFTVAEVVARLFPDYQRFVLGVVQEGILPASHFPPGPYESDMLVRRSRTDVWFRTPGNAVGMGTAMSMLAKGRNPITGAAMLFPSSMDLVVVAFKLPADDTDLDWAILDAAERTARVIAR